MLIHLLGVVPLLFGELPRLFYVLAGLIKAVLSAHLVTLVLEDDHALHLGHDVGDHHGLLVLLVVEPLMVLMLFLGLV